MNQSIKEVYENTKKTFLNLANGENTVILLLILYISVLSIYTPRHIVSLVNLPIVKLLILGGILYIGRENITIALFTSIALIVTINLDNTLKLAETNTVENFENKKEPEPNDDVVDGEEEDSDSDDDSDEDDSDSDDDSDEDDSDSDDEEEGFDIKNLKPSKNLDDGFTNLHKAIHELEQFIVTEKRVS